MARLEDTITDYFKRTHSGRAPTSLEFCDTLMRMAINAYYEEAKLPFNEVVARVNAMVATDVADDHPLYTNYTAPGFPAPTRTRGR